MCPKHFCARLLLCAKQIYIIECLLFACSCEHGCEFNHETLEFGCTKSSDAEPESGTNISFELLFCRAEPTIK